MLKDNKERLTQWMELWRLTDNVYTTFLKQWKLSLNEYFVLRCLFENSDGVEPKKLADFVNIQPQLVTIILRHFERRNFISRHENSQDHRRKSIILTSIGVEFAKKVCLASDQLDLYGLSAFSEEEQTKLLEFSERFYQTLREGVMINIGNEDEN